MQGFNLTNILVLKFKGISSKVRFVRKIPLLASLGSLIFSSFAVGSEPPSQVDILVPEKSVNGSFVIRVELNQQTEADGNVELWRSRNNEDFVLVTSQAKVAEVSQNLYKSGKYNYLARLVSEVDGKQKVFAESPVASIEVELRHNRFLANSEEY